MRRLANTQIWVSDDRLLLQCLKRPWGTKRSK